MKTGQKPENWTIYPQLIRIFSNLFKNYIKEEKKNIKQAIAKMCSEK